MTIAKDKGDVNGYKTNFSVTINYARNNLSRDETLWIEEEYLMIAPNDDGSIYKGNIGSGLVPLCQLRAINLVPAFCSCSYNSSTSGLYVFITIEFLCITSHPDKIRSRWT